MNTPPPEFKSNGAGIYRVLFHDDWMIFRVERINEDRRGVTGEVKVTTTHPGLDADVHGPARLNLVSTSAQTTLARTLAQGCPIFRDREDPVKEWTRVVGRVCRDVLRAHREGEPVVSLAAYEPKESVRSRIERSGASFVPDRHITTG